MDYDLTGLVIENIPLHVEGWIASMYTEEFDAVQIIEMTLYGTSLHKAEKEGNFADAVAPGLDRFIEEVMDLTDDQLQPLENLLVSIVCFVCGLCTGKADDFDIDLEGELKITLVERGTMHYAVVAEFPIELVPYLPNDSLIFDLKRVLN